MHQRVGLHDDDSAAAAQDFEVLGQGRKLLLLHPRRMLQQLLQRKLRVGFGVTIFTAATAKDAAEQPQWMHQWVGSHDVAGAAAAQDVEVQGQGRKLLL